MKTTYETIYNQLLNSCDQMLSILNKANEAVENNLINENDLLLASLAPDMFNFTKQVQVFSDGALGGVYRLSGATKPSIEDNEASLADLIARVEVTKKMIQEVEMSSLNVGDTLHIHLPWMPEGSYVEGADFAEKFVLQNTFFHLVTAYNIFRMKGGLLGKMDYITNLELRFK
jgi:uncharacterized protein